MKRKFRYIRSVRLLECHDSRVGCGSQSPLAVRREPRICFRKECCAGGRSVAEVEAFACTQAEPEAGHGASTFFKSSM